jgi:SAM-dependent methyltransferase
MAGDIATDPVYLAYQYGDAEKLRARYETHQRYSVIPDNFPRWVIDQINVAPGQRVLDVGCGPGTYHAPLVSLGARVAAFDFSAGMASEALANARANGYLVDVGRASAEAIPFSDASFDRVMANHMLYHVPDIPRALREIRRVARPGGRVVLTTNGPGQGRIFELHQHVARDCGFVPTEIASARFTLGDLPLVQSVFPDADVRHRENALMFPDAEPALRYYASYWVDEIEARPEDGSHREPLIARMRELIENIVAREGELRVPKDAGCFVVDV